MDRPRLIRGLRIAVSAVCGILCVLLIVLWVRSYWWQDDVVGCVSDKLYFQFGSSPGTCWLALSTSELPGTRWKVHAHSIDEILKLPHPLLGEFGQKFDLLQGRLFGSIGVPYWFAISLIVGGAKLSCQKSPQPSAGRFNVITALPVRRCEVCKPQAAPPLGQSK